MQPYQKAALANKEHGEIANTAFQGGVNVISQMMPLLSQYVPPLLALKGLSKLNSGISSFIKAASNSGQQPEQIVDFIRNKVSPSQEQKPQGNVIEQYSPELFQFLKSQIDSGRDVMQAGALAQNENRFASVIQKMSKDHKANWSSILQTVFGGPANASQQEQNVGQEAAISQSQGPGPGQQALMQVLKKINQRMGQ